MSMSIPFLVVTIITIVFGILNCFFGYWWFRVGLVICGLLIGAVIGALISVFFAPQLLFILMIAFAIGLAILFGVLKKVGLFVLCFFAGSGIVAIPVFSKYISGYLSNAASYALAKASDIFPDLNLTSPLIISLLIGLAVAIIAVIFEKPVVIIISAVYGGVLLAGSATSIFNFNDMTKTILSIVLAVAGVLVQSGIFGVIKKKNKGAK
ncbi:MAG: hypothetical protein II745_02345 [Lachnospiraceae bacterium]|nr:hypothetical protein [Lachnospiraceae bacterium]